MPTPCAKIIQKNVRSFTTWLKKFIPKKAAIERDILSNPITSDALRISAYLYCAKSATRLS